MVYMATTSNYDYVLLFQLHIATFLSTTSSMNLREEEYMETSFPNKCKFPKKFGSFEEKNSEKFENGKSIVEIDKIFVDSEAEVEMIEYAFKEPKAYQIVLFLITQMGYFGISGSMLSIAYFEPSKESCTHFLKNASLNESSRMEIFKLDFKSLLIEWNIQCGNSNFTILASTSLMTGAMFGSFSLGYMADYYGRKYAVEGSMFFISLGNLFMAFFGDFSWAISALIYFILGVACGGYIVTNLVLLIESIDSSQNRLLAVSLNGFPFGMIFTAFLGYLTGHWKMYHLIISLVSVIFLSLLEIFAYESWRWLMGNNKQNLAFEIRKKIAKKYLKNSRRKNCLKIEMQNNDDFIKNNETAKYTYLDLFRNCQIRSALLLLFLCFFSSSVVSFGLFFSADLLPGNRYLNLGGMGVGKFILGFLPYWVSFWVGRRPIMLVSVGVANISCWGLIFTWLYYKDSFSILITLFGLILTAATDPTWKINHLYSMELFPTPVRNMSRGLCQVMARIGSLSGPIVIYLRSRNELLPFWIFGGLLTSQFVICYFYLPETKNCELPKEMPPNGRIKLIKIRQIKK